MWLLSVEQFMNGVNKNAARIKAYKQPNDGSDGTADCIGLIIGGLRLAGVKYTGIHGSNYFARLCMKYVDPIIEENDLSVGDIVYKAKTPGQKGYALPDRYKPGGQYYDGDLNDYYHVGVVKSVNPLCIEHCSTGGMHYDDSIGKWAYYGQCNYVDYEGGEEMKWATVVRTSDSKGDKVNMRIAPSKAGKIVEQVPFGARIEILQDNGDWCKVRFGDKEGWMMSNYIEFDGQSDEGGIDNQVYLEINSRLDSIMADIEAIRNIIGRG